MPTEAYLEALTEVTRGLSAAQLMDITIFCGIDDPYDERIPNADYTEILEQQRIKRAKLMDQGLWEHTLYVVTQFLADNNKIPNIDDRGREGFMSSVDRGFNTLDRAENNVTHNAGYRTDHPLAPHPGGPGYLGRLYNSFARAGLDVNNMDPAAGEWFAVE